MNENDFIYEINELSFAYPDFTKPKDKYMSWTREQVIEFVKDFPGSWNKEAALARYKATARRLEELRKKFDRSKQ